MSYVELTLPTTSPDAFMDQVKIYKRETATSIILLDTVALGTATYADPAGLVGDEYYVTFFSSTENIESLPSPIYKVRTYWAADMGVVLELQTTSPNPEVDTVGIYRRRYGDSLYLRIAAVSLGTRFYTDADGEAGDIYHTTFINSVSLAESQPSPYVVAGTDTNMVVVTGIAVDPRAKAITDRGGSWDPLGGTSNMVVTLRWERKHLAPSVNGQTVIRTTYKLSTLVDGRWSVALIPNDLFSIPDTYYEFLFTDGERYFKRISSTYGLAQNFANLEDVLPLELR